MPTPLMLELFALNITGTKAAADVSSNTNPLVTLMLAMVETILVSSKSAKSTGDHAMVAELLTTHKITLDALFKFTEVLVTHGDHGLLPEDADAKCKGENNTYIYFE